MIRGIFTWFIAAFVLMTMFASIGMVAFAYDYVAREIAFALVCAMVDGAV